MKIFRDVYLNFEHEKNIMFKIYAGETGRGIRLNLPFSTSGKNFKNYIKINDKIYETNIENITTNTVDIIFPPLELGVYYGEIQVQESDEIIKSGIYQIEVDESFLTSEASELKEISSDLILENLQKIEENFKNKIEIFDNAIEENAGLSAYDIWLNAGNHGDESDFIDSLRGKDSNVNFTLDDDGNLFLDRL